MAALLQPIWETLHHTSQALFHLSGKNNKDNVFELVLNINIATSFFSPPIFNIVRQNVCTYQVKHQCLFVVSSHELKVCFNLGFYIALVSSKETDSSYTLHQIRKMPCLHSQRCYFSKHIEGLSWARDERTRPNLLTIWKSWISTASAAPLPVLNLSRLLSESISMEPSFTSPSMFKL